MQSGLSASASQSLFLPFTYWLVWSCHAIAPWERNAYFYLSLYKVKKDMHTTTSLFHLSFHLYIFPFKRMCFIITLIYSHSLSFLYFKHSLRPHNLWWTIPHQVEMLSRSLHGFGCTCYRNPQWSVTRSVIREPDRDKINEKNVLETFSKISLRQLG